MSTSIYTNNNSICTINERYYKNAVWKIALIYLEISCFFFFLNQSAKMKQTNSCLVYLEASWISYNSLHITASKEKQKKK